MIRFLISTAAYLIANAVGLLVAVLLLPGFNIDFVAFVVAVLIFSLVQTISGPLVTKLSMKHMPQLLGGIALITIFLGLLITAAIMPAMEIGGISNLLAATLLVWLGSLFASILLPIYVFKQLSEKAKDNRAATEEATARANAAAERAERAAQKAANPPGSGV